jgi:hypothetical protein
MSVYNANVTTRILDPVFDRKNFRSEFRLNRDSVYLSNMRLIQMGMVDTSTSPPTSTFFNPVIGAFCIKSIQLFDGNQLLDQMLEASLYRAFKTFNTSHDENLSIDSWVGKTNLTFAATGNQSIAANTAKVDDITIKGLFQSGNLTSSDAEFAIDTEKTSWLSLKGFLGFLTSSLYVPTDVFKNVRLVIQWKSPAELKDLLVDQTLSYATLEGCALVVDELNPSDARDAVMRNYEGVVYRAVEHDMVTVPAITGLAANESRAQENSFLINGFNGKQVERLLAIQSPTDQATWVDAGELLGAGNQASTAQRLSTFQFRVNGANKLPRDGYTRKNQRLAGLTDSYGECTLVPTSNFVYVPSIEPILSDGSAGTPNDSQNIQGLMGQFDYTCCELRESVTELVVQYSRTGVAGNAGLTQSLRLNLFAEVNKAVSVDKSSKGYVVQYL